MTSTAPVEVVPFWQRLGPISRYPLQSGALLHVLLFTALRLADLALGGIAGLIVSAFLQRASGYRATWVAGRCVQREGEITAERPGRLVRMNAGR